MKSFKRYPHRLSFLYLLGIGYLYFSLFFLSPIIAFAQNNSKSFSKLVIEVDGQETSGAKAVVQDQQGYMWFITETNLIRYDGIQFKLYKNIPGDSTSIRERKLETLHIDRAGTLWVGTTSGLSRYDENCDCFSHYYFGSNQFQEHEIPSFPLHGVVDVTEDSKGDLWVAMLGGGLFRFDKEKDQFIRYLNHPGEGDDLGADYLRVILADRNNNIWIGTGIGAPQTGNGLIRYHPETGAFERFTHDPDDPNSLLDNRVSALMEDKEGKIWIGTFKSGLHYYDPQKETLIRKEPDEKNPDKIQAPQSDIEVWGFEPFVNIIHQDELGGFWIGTFGKGINHFDGQTGQCTFYNPGQSDHDLFKWYWTLFEDRQGQLWLGSIVGSLFKMDLYGRHFTKYPELAAAQKSCESPVEDNVVWIGTLGDGLRRLDFNTGKIIKYRHDPSDITGLTNNIVRGVYADQDNMIWIGLGIETELVASRTDRGGLNRLDVENGVFYHYPVKAHDSLVSSETVFTIQEDKEGYLWLGTGKGGIYRSNKEKTAFKPFPFPAHYGTSLPNSVVYYVHEADDKLWASTELDSTLHYFDYERQQFIPFLTGYSTNFIEVDHKGWYWIGTWDNGLIHLNPIDKSYTHYTLKDGLPNNNSVIALEGEAGKIWITTTKGMALFDTQTKQFSAYGLPREYFHESGLKTRDGRLIFGGNSALYTFYPGQLDGNPFEPELFLQDLQISGETYDLSEYRTNPAGTVHLDYHQNDLTFDFVGFHFSQPSKNQYKYQLEPYDKDWIDAGTQSLARYTNLDPGEYTFRFLSANSEGVWSETPAFIAIDIAPFIWTTWWAVLIYLALFVGLTYAWYSFKLSQKAIKQEAIRLKELNEFKSRFYTNITHEFRTPLTVIQGMAESLSGRIDDQPQEKLGLIQKNSKRLLELINQMLDLSKLQTGRLKINYRQQDMITYLRYLVESHESYARSKGLSLQFYSEEDEMIMDVDEYKVERILINLISNAIKYTPEHGKILVATKAVKIKDEQHLQIKIQDNGLGIPAEALPHIFERYFRVNTELDGEQYGSGIGLALVKELVNLLGGTISVESTPQKGTSFLLHLPVLRESPQKLATEQVPLNVLNREEEILENNDSEEILSNGEQPLLLLIEDNSDVAYYIQHCLVDQYQIVHHRNGERGLQMAFDLIPDIIISDVMMPGMDGFNVCRHLKTDERTNHIPIILLTAKASAEDKLVGLQYGADAYLTKPFNKHELRTRLVKLLEIRKTLQAKYSATVNDDQRSLARTNNLHPFLSQIESIILKNLSNEKLSVTELSQYVHLSNSQVSRKIKALSGMSTNLFIRSIRLREARKLLAANTHSISEIAFQTGFSSPGYFSQIFKKAFGESPSLFQNKK